MAIQNTYEESTEDGASHTKQVQRANTSQQLTICINSTRFSRLYNKYKYENTISDATQQK
jgi:hypothetical protein